MITAYDIVKALLRTEKGTFLEANRQYVFEVANNANKVEIKKAVEEIYNVKVQAVNTIKVLGKLKRVRQAPGYSAAWKKAIVTLKEGNKIETT